MSKGYGVFGHVPDNADDDGLLPYEDDDSGVSWGHALRRRNPWKRGDDEDADYDDGRYDIDDTDDTNGGRGIYAGKNGGVGGISGETGGILGSSGAAGSRDVTFGGTDSLSAADAVMPYRLRQGRSVWFDDEDEGHFAGSAKRAEAHAVPILALRNDVESSSSNAVLARARSIARKAATMVINPVYSENHRTGYAELDGILRGTTSPSSRYRTSVQFDLDTGEEVGGKCSCPAYGRGYGMCKHMIALAFIFCDDPQRFEGYRSGAVRPSRTLIDYMEHVDRQDAQAKARRRNAVMRRFDATQGKNGANARRTKSGYGSRAGTRGGGYQGDSETVGLGQVQLVPILSFIDGVWSVEFKIGSASNGSSYVLKSIPQFVLAMANGDYADYGQKLAFIHTPDMLDDDSRPLLDVLDDAMAVRRAAEQQDRYYGHIAIDRHLTLSAPEVARLLSVREGRGVQLVLNTWFSGQPASVPVDGGEPDFLMRIARRDFNTYGPDAGYLLTGVPAVETVIDGGKNVWLLLASTNPAGAVSAMVAGSQRKSAAGCRFVRCPKRLIPLRGLLGDLFEPDGEGQVIAGDDIALFARTLLPQLVGAGLLEASEIPRELAELSPTECSLQFYLDRDEHGVQCEVKARYGDAIVPLLPDGPTVHAEGERSIPLSRGVIGRDFDAEHLAIDVVREFFTMPDQRKRVAAATHQTVNGFRTPAARKATKKFVSDAATIDRDDTTQIVRLFDEGLPALKEVGEVFTTPAFDRLIAPKPPSVKVGLSIKGNLVEISPLADEVPPDEVGALLSSYRRRQRFHQLKDGTLVKLSGANLSTLDRLASDLDLSEQQLNSGLIELPGGRAFLLDGELPDDGSDVVKDASFTEYIDDLKIIDPKSYEVPDSLKHILRPYQVEGFQWLNTLCDKGFGGILADEMGLGKSVQLIALLLSRYQRNTGEMGNGSLGPSLIVCPASLVYNWGAEFTKFAPSFNAVVVAGTKAERRTAIGRAFRADEPTVLITSYDLLRRDVDDYTANEQRFNVMALDEAQYIKNHTTKIAKAVKAVAADHRFALTGTPIENRLSELWSIFDFLMPGLLGSYKRFHERYELPISNARAADGSTAEGRAAAQVNPEAARVSRQLQSLVGVFIKRRLKSQVLTDLPDKLETTLTVRLAGEQRKLYAAHEQRLRMQLEHSEEADFNTSKIRILAELTKLRQICCDPRLLYADAKDQSAKLAAITELVETCVNEGKKALIFSQFTSFLDLIAERFDAQGLRYYTITGSTPKKKRLELVDQFNADDTPAFLISLKAGNTGLNLTGASVVIHADPWWNAAAQDQATDRAHRIGQTEDVNVYQVVAKDTIEERILELQHTKSELARQFTDASLLADEAGTGASALTEAPASIATLTKDDLLNLLG